MTWQPIETAPKDVPVRLGRYADYTSDGLSWRTDIGVAWETRRTWMGRTVVVRKCCDLYTHWTPLPQPPEVTP